ncbi:MAG TPA: GNAT family N-acetyltransferase [Polyangiaceae bacterium]|nr:GNAT family N-acetyltransferase [Polyangiaceae bacterium]
MTVHASQAARPAAFSAPQGIRIDSALGPDAVSEGIALLEGTYWNEGVSPEMMARSFLASTVWVGARDDSGALVGMARALSDLSKVAWIFDVVVRPDWRGKGIAQAIMRLILSHPAVRDVAKVRLATRDAERLYEKFGFRIAGPPKHLEMIRARS